MNFVRPFSVYESEFDDAFTLAKALQASTVQFIDRVAQPSKKKFQKCAVGKEVVAFIAAQLLAAKKKKTGTDEALTVANNMIYAGFLVHVTNEHMMVNDDTHFYRLTIALQQRIKAEKQNKGLAPAPAPTLKEFMALPAGVTRCGVIAKEEPIYDNPVMSPDMPTEGPNKIVCSAGNDCPCYTHEKYRPFSYFAIPGKMIIEMQPGESVKVCMCGQTKNPPFCDYSHREYNEKNNTSLKPVFVTNEENSVQTVWLCQCGHSKNRPFCNGSHRMLKAASATS